MEIDMFIHGLLQRNEKWFSPSEIEEDDDDDYQDFAVPVDANGNFFDTYEIELVSYKNSKLGNSIKIKVDRIENRLQFDFHNFRIRMFPIGTPMKYSGELHHPDFAYSMVKIEFYPPEIDDLLFEETSHLIIGCNVEEYT